MWKKDESSPQSPETQPDTAPRPERTPRSAPAGHRATIGRSIRIKGDVTGDEDLVIDGRIDGSVDLKEHAVTVGPEGQVKASIVARVITVEGQVEGDLTAEEQIHLKATARVKGDIAAARVALDDGARFLGGVDMGEVARKDRSAGRADSTASASSNSKSSSSAASSAGSSSKSSAGSNAGSSSSAGSDASASPGSVPKATSQTS